jgi:hypothetical protein
MTIPKKTSNIKHIAALEKRVTILEQELKKLKNLINLINKQL